MEQLIVDQPGVFIRKKSERILVEKQNELLAEVPLLDLEQVLIAAGGVALSSDVVRECATRGIPIAFLSGRGNPYATVISAELAGTVATRREQLLAYRCRLRLKIGFSRTLWEMLGGALASTCWWQLGARLRLTASTCTSNAARTR